MAAHPFLNNYHQMFPPGLRLWSLWAGGRRGCSCRVPLPFLPESPEYLVLLNTRWLPGATSDPVHEVAEVVVC